MTYLHRMAKRILEQFSFNGIGLGVADVCREVCLARDDQPHRVPTGISDFDTILDGGFRAKELIVAVAPEKRLQSIYLLNAMYHAVRAGRRVAYVAQGPADQAIMDQLNERVAYMNEKESKKEKIVVEKQGKYFSLAGGLGCVVRFPNENLTVARLEELLKQQVSYFGFNADMIIVESIDDISRLRVDCRTQDKCSLRAVTGDLKRIACQYGITVMTAALGRPIFLLMRLVERRDAAKLLARFDAADHIFVIGQNSCYELKKSALLTIIKKRNSILGGRIGVYLDPVRRVLMDVERADNLGLRIPIASSRLLEAQGIIANHALCTQP